MNTIPNIRMVGLFWFGLRLFPPELRSTPPFNADLVIEGMCSTSALEAI